MKKDPQRADYFLDITEDVCPMTFVKTRLKIEKMSPGQTLEIRLRGAEPLENVPASVAELGHEIVAIVREESNDAEAPHRIVVRLAG